MTEGKQEDTKKKKKTTLEKTIENEQSFHHTKKFWFILKYQQLNDDFLLPLFCFRLVCFQWRKKKNSKWNMRMLLFKLLSIRFRSQHCHSCWLLFFVRAFLDLFKIIKVMRVNTFSRRVHYKAVNVKRKWYFPRELKNQQKEENKKECLSKKKKRKKGKCGKEQEKRRQNLL